jgi:hypothetical protein
VTLAKSVSVVKCLEGGAARGIVRRKEGWEGEEE